VDEIGVGILKRKSLPLDAIEVDGRTLELETGAKAAAAAEIYKKQKTKKKKRKT
jgi:hypothetical protein